MCRPPVQVQMSESALDLMLEWFLDVPFGCANRSARLGESPVKERIASMGLRSIVAPAASGKAKAVMSASLVALRGTQCSSDDAWGHQVALWYRNHCGVCGVARRLGAADADHRMTCVANTQYHLSYVCQSCGVSSFERLDDVLGSGVPMAVAVSYSLVFRNDDSILPSDPVDGRAVAMMWRRDASSLRLRFRELAAREKQAAAAYAQRRRTPQAAAAATAPPAPAKALPSRKSAPTSVADERRG